MPNTISTLYEGGGGVDARVQAGATSAALIALGPTFPTAFYTDRYENIVLWPMNSTAAQTLTLAIWEHTAAVPTLATINRMIGVSWGQGSDQIITTDRVTWGLVTATEYAAKGLANISVTPNVYISITVGASQGGVWYLRYGLGHAPLANFYD